MVCPMVGRPAILPGFRTGTTGALPDGIYAGLVAVDASAARGCAGLYCVDDDGPAVSELVGGFRPSCKALPMLYHS